MKLRIDLEVESTDDTLDDGELVEFHTAVINYIKDELLENFSEHVADDFEFTVQSCTVTDTTAEVEGE